ncbi:helix-turn-helix domain-containing protein [Actomonas aquatica]|uniref:Helix-turn-helix domain-containing protein n=1 Tax=Actomonas aquatica TaxID=2866162 RepID=A0ABZ1C4V5_9BACT|nr:helix-turn-helix domain-containing protein [Opitutus sp. WL0086]WRQ86273.1 helix-turn-helix domain-containing protein [Opitutus sp. WL0086]
MRSRFIKLVEEGSLTFTQVCARFGISRKTGYKWLKRFREQGDAGLHELSRAPLQHGRRVAPAIERAVRAVLERHPEWSDGKVRAALAADGLEPLPALGTIEAIRQRPERGRVAVDASRLQVNDVWRLVVGPASVAFGVNHRGYALWDEATGFVLAADVLPEDGEGGRRTLVRRACAQHGLPTRLRWPVEALLEEAGTLGYHTPETVELMRQGVQVEFVAEAVVLPVANVNAEADEAVWGALRERLRHLPAGADLGGLGRRAGGESREVGEAVFVREWRESLPRWRGRLSAWADGHNAGARDAAGALTGPATRYRPSRRGWREAGAVAADAGAAESTRRVSEKGLLHFEGQRWLLGRAFAGCDVELSALPETGRWRVSFAGQALGWLESADALDGDEWGPPQRVRALEVVTANAKIR